jgi:hypothetical protein
VTKLCSLLSPDVSVAKSQIAEIAVINRFLRKGGDIARFKPAALDPVQMRLLTDDLARMERDAALDAARDRVKSFGLSAPLATGIVPFDLAGQQDNPLDFDMTRTQGEDRRCPRCSAPMTKFERGPLCTNCRVGDLAPVDKRQKTDDLLAKVEAELHKRGINPLLTKDVEHAPAGQSNGGQFVSGSTAGASSAPTKPAPTRPAPQTTTKPAPTKPAPKPTPKPAATPAKPRTRKQKEAAAKKEAAKKAREAKQEASKEVRQAKKDAKEAAREAKQRASDAAAAVQRTGREATANAAQDARDRHIEDGKTPKKPQGVDGALVHASQSQKGLTDVGESATLTKYSADQPRDDHGRFGEGGGAPTVPQMRSALRANEGFSLNVRTGKAPTNGYMVSFEGHSGILPYDKFMTDNEATKKFVGDWLEKEQATVAKAGWFGGWYDKDHGEVCLDPSENVTAREDAISRGVGRNQQSVWDVVNHEEIPTGGSGGRED